MLLLALGQILIILMSGGLPHIPTHAHRVVESDFLIPNCGQPHWGQPSTCAFSFLTLCLDSAKDLRVSQAR